VTANLPAIPNLALFQITIDFHGDFDLAELEKILNKSIRWIKCMPNSWLVLSSSHADRWWARLHPLLGDTDTMLICEVDSETIQCWIQKWKIDWMTEAREQIRKTYPGQPS
jgi:hypothetical protein